MGTFIDLTGNVFGDLTVMERVDNNTGGRVAWLCMCKCGNTTIKTTQQLRRGKTISCGCLVGAQHRRELAGRRFGRLVAEEIVGYNDFNKILWRCKCDCGNDHITTSQALLQGITKSCGCLQRDSTKQLKFEDISGNKYNRLTVIKKTDKRVNGSVVWECLCDCGNITYVSTKALKNGNTKSCGCYHRDELSKRMYKDISGQRFGKLVAMSDGGIQDGQHLWLCKCDCGNECYVPTNSLTSGNTQSCGCTRSRAENVIEQFLKSHNIPYYREKRFIGCEDKCKLPFDFYLLDRNIALEYDGEFHYIEFPNLGNDLAGQQRRDAIKTKYCEENDIILLRIPYWEKDNIESILSDWLFLNTEVDDDEELSEAVS